ncbi:hypothetical protein STAFG_3974 [Streptomyces afghaniensis 772]|uniref:Uncharacterized protein n=1 Tax=Streptomyces afghaniensis 772 TaxID=1283301 RepID=S4NKT7_9ACTN|nr:hypothetical protein STAFG_3974 [Streptomyces afghaniensis 772]
MLIYPEQGFMISQPVPEDVRQAFERLCREGFTSRLLSTTGKASA